MVSSQLTAAAASISAPEVVLVVENEPALRTLLRRMLDIHGLVARETATAEEAITVAQSVDLPIDALLTDLQLPEMSGLELATQVLALRPGLPVVFMSGYPRDVAFGAAGREYRTAEFLQKPFTPSQLGDAMRRALLSRTPPPGDTTETPPPGPPTR